MHLWPKHVFENASEANDEPVELCQQQVKQLVKQRSAASKADSKAASKAES